MLVSLSDCLLPPHKLKVPEVNIEATAHGPNSTFNLLPALKVIVYLCLALSHLSNSSVAPLILHSGGGDCGDGSGGGVESYVVM